MFRYGAEFQEDYESDIAEARQLYALSKAAYANNQDSEGVVREATIRTLQSRLMRLSIALKGCEEMGDDPHLIADTTAKLTRALADLGRLDIMSDKYRREIQAKIRQEARAEAAEELSKELKNDGISAELEASIKRILIGK